jgi:protein gp37
MAYRLKGRFGYPEDDPFKPMFHPDKLEDIYNLPKAHRRVFLDSMGDWFSEGVKTRWIAKTIDAIRDQPEHTFLVLTKRPDRILDVISSGLILGTPKNMWFGVSVTCQEDVWRIQKLKTVWAKRFISFEPLHGPISCDLSGIDWVIIGAESGNRKGKIKPMPFWVDNILQAAVIAGNIPVFMKDNLMPYIDEMYPQLQEFPEDI